jgi:cardiolipin synthase
MIAWILLALHVVGVVSSVHAVMTTRTAQGAIAWAVSLVSFPYVAVPAYWIFGRRRFAGYVSAFRDREEEIEELSARVRASIEPYAVDESDRTPEYRALRELARGPLYGGHELELLIDGEATFDSIVAGIAEARDYVLVQFYILRDDGLGRRLQHQLIERAREGIRVWVLYDEIGSSGLSRAYREELEAAGVRISPFNTTRGRRNRFQLNFRNHRKTVVVDGREAWIGGHNVGDEYLGLDPKFGAWRDTHMRLLGPAAISAQAWFLADWYWATREWPELDWEIATAGEHDADALVFASGPADERETAQLFFLHALQAARERIWIATPYFVPDEAITAALELAALRGVDVRILIPARPDNVLVGLSAWWFIEELEGVNLHFYRYQDGFMHQKVILVDRAIAGVGTHNFDNRSFRLNFEIMALAFDDAFAREVEAMLLADLERSEPIDMARLAERGFAERLAVRVARLMAPVQ